MKVIYLLIISLFCSTVQFAQHPDSALTKRYKKFLPKGYTVVDTTVSDFNNDKIDDIVIVASDEKEAEKNRAIIILNNKNKPILSSSSTNAVLCKECGGVFGDPYEGISLTKNVLTIYHYGGSSWRWGSEYTFRFQNDQWELIGLHSASYWTNADCPDGDAASGAFNLTDVNFSTKKMHVIKTKDDECKPFSDKWIKFKSYKKIFLKDFNVDEDYVPKVK